MRVSPAWEPQSGCYNRVSTISLSLNVPVPLTANIMETLQALKIDDMGACDHSAIVRFYEKLAKVEVRK